jgi:hypothetical protein
MGLIERFQALFRARQPQEQPVTLVTEPARVATLAARFSVENDRRSMVMDSRTMYDADPRVRTIIQTLARDVTKNGFELTVEGARSAEALAIANELFDRLDVWSRLDDWVRLTLRDGDGFFEVGATGTGDIVHVSRKPTLEMFRWSNERDEFIEPSRAFYWTDQPVAGDTPPAGAVYFAEWQMIQASWDRDEDNRYGRPLLTSGRSAYRRMEEGELDISIRRRTRAGMRYVHTLEDANDIDIEAYKARNQDVLGDPSIAIADFFSNKRTSISAIQGDAHLGDIEDVLHHIRTFWLASPVPMSLLGYGQDLNRDVLDEQEEQYRRALESVSEWVTGQFLRPLLERQWLLKGIWPDALRWNVEWASKTPLTATSLDMAAKALVSLRATSLLTNETMLRLLSAIVPDFDATAELAALAAQKPDEVARMAQMSADDDNEDDGDEGEDDGN